MAHKLDQVNSKVELLGVEPFGADSFYRSLKQDTPIKIEKVNTIADSLGSPMAMDFSFRIAQRRVTSVEKVTDDAIREAMVLMRDHLSLMVEPACATSLAGLMGPFKDRCIGKKVGLIACGSNISFERYNQILSKL
jgi:threonine dehydratase